MPTEINTPDQLEYRFHPAPGGCFSFKVRAANDAHIALCSENGESGTMYEVFIGGWGNTKSVIRKNKTKPDCVEVMTPNILHSGEFRKFWIRWHASVITVGRDGETDAFLTWEDTEPIQVNYVGICTGWGASGTWFIDEEINTPDQLEYKLYPAPKGCFTFKVRAANDAHIALLSENGETGPMFEVFIGGWGNTKSVIRKNKTKPDCVEVMTANFLHPGEFRGFWIRWHDTVILAGKEGEDNPFITYEDADLIRVNYVGICTGWGATGTWLIDEDQFIQSGPVLGFAPPRSDGAGCWVPAADGAIPPGAVEGGMDGSEQLYIARAVHEGSLIPGKLHPSHGVTYVSWGGGEHGHNEYEVLCGTGGMWIPSSDGQVPDQAVPAGESAEGEPLFIGRASHNGCIVIGKIQPSHGCCYIPYNGEELAFSNYEVFVTN